MNIFEWTEETPVTANNLNEMEDILNDNILDEYSTDETLTNKKWIDDKPIYRKVIDTGVLPNATIKQLAHNISNLDTITNFYGVAYNSTSKNRITLPYVDTQSQYNVQMYVNNTNVYLNVSGNQSSFNSSFVVIEYTKTIS